MSEPVIPQCAACRVAGSYAHCDACPKTPWQEYASSEDGMREYAKAEPVMTDMRCGKCGYELPDQAPQIDYRPCGYCILLEQCEQQAATIERLTRLAKQLYDSACPNERDHPTMWRAWRAYDAALSKQEHVNGR